jgi:RNA polymerase sigma-70 factor (ECF subfamily)
VDRSKSASDELNQKLLAAVARSDEGAFVELYHGFSTSIFNYLLRLVHDQHIAEELLQETFLVVWQGAGQFRRRSRVRTWLFRIAHNKAVSWLRRHQPQSLVDNPEIPDDRPDPETLSLTNWRNEQLLLALDELSPNHRAVVELAFVHDLAYAEIAQIMECPVGTVKSRMSHALKRLSRLMTDANLEQ